MKKIILLIFSISFLLCGCTMTSQPEKEIVDNAKYVKSIWITYYEMGDFCKGKSEKEFTKEINSALDYILKCGFNTITVQVRAWSDAMYKSNFYPTSKYFSGDLGDELTYDPFGIICNIAREKNLKVEAWINPYRVSQDNKYVTVNNDTIIEKWIKENNKNVIEFDGALYLNPAKEDVIKLIVSGVKEIIDNYSINGIHIDDYFYPTTSKEFDEKDYNDLNTNLSLAQWRRENVTKLIKSIHDEISKSNDRIRFGVSPASDIDNNYNLLYADVFNWIDNGYLDYVCPQIYFGFYNEIQPFMFTLKKWQENVYNADLFVGLPLYKCNKKDDYASLENNYVIKEFINNDDVIARQIKYIAELPKIKGYYIFSYSSLVDEKNKDEVSLMLDVMQSNNLP